MAFAQNISISFKGIKPFILCTLVCLLHCVPTVSAQQKDDITAFPGAMGGGKYTTGGRGGKVIKVTNLNDDGPGSLRKAIKAKGSRTIVFDISGTIELKSQLAINNDHITIAGQTAPGDGICIKGHEVRINANNVIIRYLRFRPGDIANTEYDALTGMRNRDIIIDHCSFSWSTDETVSLYDNENFTLQWSIISESLNNSVHSKGAHGYGGIWGGKNASFINNILAHHSSRNPRLQGTRYQLEDGMEKAEIVNNIIYNWGSKAIYGGENGRYNLINNLFIPGPASPDDKIVEILEPYKPYGQFHMDGNQIWGTEGWYNASEKNISLPNEEYTKHLTAIPFCLNISTNAMDSETAYNLLLKRAGVSHRRDAVDQRIINNITNRSFTYGNMGIIDSQNDTEGWPALESLPPLLDSDGDGIPDEWELNHGLNPNNPKDGNSTSLDGSYTNLEVYLNSLVDSI
ncbi:pectate lyase [Perlabentimonas gracilis]|uniref:pectate lyase n=1 Tax=Perlabentimonas gracilis TaxID=2715279 RepID=UPI001C626FE2|nr:pectate lyase [Perlabentimonas gracilis]